MTRTISRVLAHSALLTLLILAGGASVASASEVTGTLSSDGSNDQGTSQEVVGATIMNVKSDQSLSGTVVSGVDSGQGTSTTTAILLSLLALPLAAIIASIYWRRQRA